MRVMADPSATIEGVTAKEKLLQRAPKWTEREAEIALRAVEREGSESQGIVDEWGDLDAQMDAAMRDSLRELDEKERKAGVEPWRP